MSHGGGKSFRADLLPVSLDDDPACLSISYVWGDPSTTGHFEGHGGEGGLRLAYNSSVFEIMSMLVEPGSTLYLWIDALCINQDDVA